ncbi:hypothetical protein RRG08_054704 [Elysia crispata]|uniref:Uncharacterized protein n=1 Tax=Elysia crispata TaxID=231223 RepID=A0AAE1E831_9GAST|nr:hypothetical protein RRG08_054704 [Elysia crispata]
MNHPNHKSKASAVRDKINTIGNKPSDVATFVVEQNREPSVFSERHASRSRMSLRREKGKNRGSYPSDQIALALEPQGYSKARVGGFEVGVGVGRNMPGSSLFYLESGEKLRCEANEERALGC